MSCETTWKRKKHIINNTKISDNKNESNFLSKEMNLLLEEMNKQKSNVEGFDLFQDSTTKSPSTTNFNLNTTLNNFPLKKITLAFIDMILSPLYEIDRGTENLVMLFLNKTGELNITPTPGTTTKPTTPGTTTKPNKAFNNTKNNEYTIDENDLWTSTDEHTYQKSKIESFTSQEMSDIKKDVQEIKKFIYNVLIIPIYFYISYNFYYVFYFRKNNKINKDDEIEELGCEEIEFSDWDPFFDKDSSSMFSTNLFTEFIFKPAKLILIFLNIIKKYNRLYCINKIAPYICFIVFFLIITILLTKWLPKLWNILLGFYNFKIDDSLYNYCSCIVWFCFIVSCTMSFFKIFNNPINRIKGFTKPVVINIVYWLIKAYITNSIIPISAVIFIIYLMNIMFFNISSKDIKYINQYIFSSLNPEEDTLPNPFFEYVKNNASHENNTNYLFYSSIINFINKHNKNFYMLIYFFNIIFYFLFEIILIFLFINFTSNIKNISSTNSVSINFAITILIIIFTIIIIIWIGMKFVTFKNEIPLHVNEPADIDCEYKNLINKTPIHLFVAMKQFFKLDTMLKQTINSFVKQLPIVKTLVNEIQKVFNISGNPIIAKDKITELLKTKDKGKGKMNILNQTLKQAQNTYDDYKNKFGDAEKKASEKTGFFNKFFNVDEIAKGQLKNQMKDAAKIVNKTKNEIDNTHEQIQQLNKNINKYSDADIKEAKKGIFEEKKIVDDFYKILNKDGEKNENIVKNPMSAIADVASQITKGQIGLPKNMMGIE